MDDYSWMDYEYGYNEPAPSYDGSINIQSPASWDGPSIYDGGGYDLDGMPSYSSPSYAADPYSVPTSDPISPYYTGGGGGGYDLGMIPPGSGMYSVGDDPWKSIQTPMAGYASGVSGVPNQASFTPGGGGGYVNPADRWLADRQASYDSMYALTRPGVAPSGGGMPQAPNAGGQRAVASQTPQMISLGQPERTLYDRYSKLLMDPSGFAGDPAYQFLFNQGEQALKRSLAAKKMTLSGKAMNDTMAYGQGMANQYMSQQLPLYQGGAREELNRFMGPAGLLPRYAAQNNATISAANQDIASRDLMERMEDGGGGGYPSMTMGGGGEGRAGLGMGGISGGYNPAGVPAYQPRLAQAYQQPQYGVPDLMDEFYGE